MLNQTDKKISGLCAGIADYFEIDVTIVRLIAVVIALSTWFIPTVLAYLIIASITPKAAKEGDIR
ncbi:MAG: hypothetical protein NVSMB39_0680 [Candidatus Saccharimonadales bacterium]